jgi:hypothetical protein
MNGYLDIERVTEDDRDFSQMDPGRLLPFVCELTAASPDAVVIPDSEQYLGEKASDNIGNRDAISEGDQ